MGYMFVIMIGCFILYYLLMPKPQVQNKEKDPDKYNKIKEDEKNCTLYKRIVHLGGHPSFNQEEKLVFKVRNNELFIEDWFLNKSEKLELDDIVDYKVQSETEISNSVTVPRVLALGALSLVAQKETKVNKQFLVLTLKKNGVEFQCIFGKHFESDNFHEIITEINRFKIQNAVV